VEFAKRAYCSIEDDNIYTVSRDTTKGDIYGVQPIYSTTLAPNSRKDSLLVHDPDVFSGGGTVTKKR